MPTGYFRKMEGAAERICLRCGAKFIPKQPNQKYCSERHKNTDKWERYTARLGHKLLAAFIREKGGLQEVLKIASK